jgi:hypothetical protein
MRLDRRLLGWGVFFILLGAEPLAVRATAVDPDLVSRWPTLWPVLLIGWGVGLVLRGTAVHWLGGALTAVTFGLMGGGAIAAGFGGMPAFSGCGGGGGTPFETRQGTLASDGHMEIEFNCGTLAVTTADGSGWQVSGTAANGAGPVVETHPDGTVTLKGQERTFNFGSARSAWDVILPRTPSLRTGVTLNAGDGAVDLSGASVGAFNLTVNAGRMSADLRSAKSLPHDGLNATVNFGTATLALPAFDGIVNLSLNAGSLEVCVPGDAAIEVHWDGTLASDDLEGLNLVQIDESTWQSVGFNPNAAHVQLDVRANAGTFQLELGGSCDA